MLGEDARQGGLEDRGQGQSEDQDADERPRSVQGAITGRKQQRGHTPGGRLLLTLLPVAAVFVVWDLYAIAQGHWDFDPEQTLGVLLPGGVPVEELLFFLVIPACAVLSFEAVRRVKGWPAGDE